MLCLGTAMAAADGDKQIGVAAAIVPQTQSQIAAQPPNKIAPGAILIANQKIKTGPGGKASLLFRDESTLTVGSNADVLLDKFVFDPDKNIGNISINMTKGALRFVGGKISKKTDVKIRTPTATIGIRGGIGIVQVSEVGDTKAIFLFGDAMVVSSGGEAQTITRPGFAIDIKNNQQSAPSKISQSELVSAFASLESGSEAESFEPSPESEGGNEQEVTEENQEDSDQEPVASDDTEAQKNSSNSDKQLSVSSSKSELKAAIESRLESNAILGDSSKSDLISSLFGSGSESSDNIFLAAVLGDVNTEDVVATELSDPSIFSSSNINISGVTIGASTPNPGASFYGIPIGEEREVTSFVGSSLIGRSITIDMGFFGAFSIPIGIGLQTNVTIPGNDVRETVVGSAYVSPQKDFILFEGLVPNSSQGFFAFGGTPTANYPVDTVTYYRSLTGVLFSSQLFGLPVFDTGEISNSLNPNAAIYWGKKSAGIPPVFAYFSGGTNGLLQTQQTYGFVLAVGSVNFDSQNQGSIQGALIGLTHLPTDANTVKIHEGRFTTLCGCQEIASIAGTPPNFYGVNAEYFSLLANNVESSKFFGNILERTTTTASGFLGISVPPGTRTTRSSGGFGLAGQLTGYSAGIGIKYSPNRFSSDPPATVGNANPENFRVETSSNKSKSKFSAAITGSSGLINYVFGDKDSDFGDDESTETTGSSAFINDEVFASLVQCNSPSSCAAVGLKRDGVTAISGGGGFVALQEINGLDGLYADCRFCSWGLGGAQIFLTENDAEFNQLFWVAGNIPSSTQIPLTGSATYRGHATAVAVYGNNNYFVKGDVVTSVDFSGVDTSGALTINDIDGGKLNASFRGFSAGANSKFSASLNGSGRLSEVSGNIRGSFFSSSESAISSLGGSFEASGTVSGISYKISGIHVQDCSVGKCN